MKIELQVILLVILGLASSQKLSEKENFERLLRCGKKMLTIPDISKSIPEGDYPGIKTLMTFPPDQWLVKFFVGLIEVKGKLVTSRPRDEDNWHSLGSFISPRHILTSSQPVTHDGKQEKWWLWHEDITEDNVKGADAILFPKETLETFYKQQHRLTVTRNVSGTVHGKDMLFVKNAWLLGIRDQKDNAKMRSPMILELEEDVEGVEYPCLVQENTELKRGDEPHIYGLTYTKQNGNELYYRNRMITDFSGPNRWILLDTYFAHRDRGGPMVMHINGKVTVVGISASLPLEESDYAYFYDMRFKLKDICFLTGICDADPSALASYSAAASRTTLPATTSEATEPTPETTEQPATTPEPTEEPTEAPAPAPQPPAPTQAPIPAQPTPPPNTPSPITRIPSASPEKTAEDDYVDNPQPPEAQAQIASEDNASHSALLMTSAFLTLFIHLVIDF